MRDGDHGPDIETLVGYTLLVGVVASVTLVAVGLVWHWIVRGDLRFDYALPATTVAQFVLGDLREIHTAETRPRTLLNLGIAVLMLTPYARVVASLAYFAVERDWRYVAITGFVLATLTYSLLG